jgi:hypothetical protein
MFGDIALGHAQALRRTRETEPLGDLYKNLNRTQFVHSSPVIVS